MPIERGTYVSLLEAEIDTKSKEIARLQEELSRAVAREGVIVSLAETYLLVNDPEDEVVQKARRSLESYLGNPSPLAEAAQEALEAGPGREGARGPDPRQEPGQEEAADAGGPLPRPAGGAGGGVMPKPETLVLCVTCREVYESDLLSCPDCTDTQAIPLSRMTEGRPEVELIGRESGRGLRLAEERRTA